MKRNVVLVFWAGLLVIVILWTQSSNAVRRPDPQDLLLWMRTGAGKDWSGAAAAGDAEAQFQVGLGLLRTNLLTMIDRVPGLSSVPVLGRRFFEKRNHAIDNAIPPEKLREAYRWIKQSADQGFAPAREAEKLFRGKIEGIGGP